MVVEPVEVAGGGVEPQEVACEAVSCRRLQVLQRGPQFRLGEGAFAPAQPGEVFALASRAGGHDVEDAAVEGRLLHLGDVLAKERRIRLVPAELDQLLDRWLRSAILPRVAN